MNAFPCDHQRILDSTSILELTQLPHHLCIIGGGYIGCEFASLFAQFGVKVTIVEALPSILASPGTADRPVHAKSFQSRGIAIQTKYTSRRSKTKKAMPASLLKMEKRSMPTWRSSPSAAKFSPRDRSGEGRTGRQRQGRDRHGQPDGNCRQRHLCHRRCDRPMDAGPCRIPSRDRRRIQCRRPRDAYPLQGRSVGRYSLPLKSRPSV